MTPLISICLPNLNSMPFLEERMESLLAQTFGDWELIISDNYSDDGSWEFFQKFAGNPKVRLSQASRRGMYANWNECLRRAQGEYVYIATSDDSAGSELLERLVAPLERFRDVDLCVCRHDETDAEGNVIPEYEEEDDVFRFLGDWMDRPHRRDRLAEFLVMLCVGCHWLTITAVLFRRTILDKTGLFRTDCLSYADTPWRYKAILCSDLIYVPERLATWRRHDAQATANLPLNKEELIYRSIGRSLEECDEMIPTTWKEDPSYRHTLLLQRRRRYLMEYHLNRGAMRARPGDFLEGCARAMVKEPAFFLRRLSSGFSWESALYGDRIDYLRSLLDRWNVKWPPEAL